MKDEPIMQVEIMSIDRIIPYARNPRKYGAAIDKVTASIQEFGFRQPIVVDACNVIVVGHVRYEAARRLGLLHVPVHRATSLSDQQIKAYRLMDNRSHESAAWDEELLMLELAELQHDAFDLTLTGFDVSELDDLLYGTNEEEKNQDDAPPLPTTPVTKLGDVWQLGNHRLVCGDACVSATYDKLLGAGKADMIYSDPPYNVNYQGKAGSIANDDLSDAAFLKLLQEVAYHWYQRIRAGSAVYVSYSEKETESFYRSLREAGFKQASCLIWLKNQFVLGRSDYHCQHEPIWYGWKTGAKHVWHGGRKKTTLHQMQDVLPLSKLDDNRYLLQWSGMNVVISGTDVQVELAESGMIQEDKPLRSELHPTMKPVALIERFIRNSSKHSDIVMDTFGGSGTTLIACENLNRSARVIELDPAYCDVILQRWKSHTGDTPTHAITGEHFAPVIDTASQNARIDAA